MSRFWGGRVGIEEYKAYIAIKRNFLSVLDKNNKLICAYCGRNDLINCTDGTIAVKELARREGREATIDHIIPISKGGSLLDPINFAVCCHKCNNEKSDQEKCINL